MDLDRRRFLQLSGLGALASAGAAFGSAALDSADYTLRIRRSTLELGPHQIVTTTTYNGQFPGPLLRLKEGRAAVVDIFNDTDRPEPLYWHGQKAAVEGDDAGAGSIPVIPAQSMRRLSLVAGRAGLHFYHPHLVAGVNLEAGLYSGQAGPLLIEPARQPGDFDREVLLVLKEFEPTLSRRSPHGYEVDYRLFSINGRSVGNAEPIRVKLGERVLFHVLNASATEIRRLALPGHTFSVVALDGNPVPTPARVGVLRIGSAERVSVMVEMNHPGVWLLGDLDDDDRSRGMGIVVEYAGAAGDPRWQRPTSTKWDYTIFGHPPLGCGVDADPPHETIEMVFARSDAARSGFNQWTINGEPFSLRTMSPRFQVRAGRSYRLKMRNASDAMQAVHLHRHCLELASVAGKRTDGILKDVVMLEGHQQVEADFIADSPGRTLFHCHQQLHMDFGFMALIDYA